jgi:hypothetical protein
MRVRRILSSQRKSSSMNDKKEEDERWEELMRFANREKMRAWAQSPGLPNPTYDSSRGWALDEFATQFEPVLCALYKDVCADLYRPLDTPEKHHGYRWMEVTRELSAKICARLLDPRFCVKGFPPGAYEPIVIPGALLEVMHPVFELSELRETGIAETFRRFEKVRVFDQATGKKATGGRKSTYDWPALRDKLEREKPRITTIAELIEWCRAHVKPLPGKRASKDGPDDNTIRPSIRKYELEKFITPRE